MNNNELEKRIAKIELRNKKVTADKSWEISKARRITIFTITYLIVGILFVLNKLNKLFGGTYTSSTSFKSYIYPFPLFTDHIILLSLWLKKEINDLHTEGRGNLFQNHDGIISQDFDALDIEYALKHIAIYSFEEKGYILN